MSEQGNSGSSSSSMLYEQQLHCLSLSWGPHLTIFLMTGEGMGGGSDEVHILYPQKSLP